MAAILNGFLPVKKKDQYSHLNTRWGDAAISAPIHGGWNASGNSLQSQGSPDLDRDLPPTPPQHHEEPDGVFIIHDEGEETRSIGEVIDGHDRENIALTMAPPAWKRRVSHSRKLSQPTNPLLNSKSIPPRRGDTMSHPGTVEVAATIPLPDSRVNSPVSRTTTPVLSFRSRLADPSLADILSPVVEGFAKDGPSRRPTPIMSSINSDSEPTERPHASSSIRSNMPRRPSVTAAYNPEGLGGMTMSSQAGTLEQQLPEINRPQSRGIGATAHMRASSRGPRASSRGPIPQKPGSVDPMIRRAPSVEPVFRRASPVSFAAHRSTSVEPTRRAPSVRPIASRGQPVDPYSQREDSMQHFTQRGRQVEPVNHHDEKDASPILPAVLDQEPLRRRAPSVEPARRRAPSISPGNRRAFSPEAPRERGKSIEPNSRRAPSLKPPSGARRAESREPRGRRGASVEPRPRVRFHSEVARRIHRRDSFSSNDGSLESDEDREDFDSKHFSPPSRVDPDFTSNRKPRRRRRSIASPMTSPTIATFAIPPRDNEQTPPPPSIINSFDSITSRAGFKHPTIPPVEKRPASRNQLQTRTRGVYADVQDDFSILAREVQSSSRSATPIETFPNMPKLSRTVFDPATPTTALPPHLLNPPQRTTSPTVGPHPSVYQAGIGTLVTSQRGYDRPGTALGNTNGYLSDSSQRSQVPHTTFTSNPTAITTSTTASDTEHPNDSRTVQATLTHNHQDQLRRKEREKAREKVTRRLEWERERIAALSGMSDCDSLGGNASGRDDRTRRVYGSGVSVTSDSEVEGGWRRSGKVMVPDDEDIWG